MVAAVGCTPETNVTLSSAEQKGIAVSGTGKVTVTPDMGLLTLGVQITRPSVTAARDAASKSMDAIRAALKQQGIEGKDVATSGFNIQPQYDFQPNRNGSPNISGYMVTNNITVKVRKIDIVSEVLDNAVMAGGNDVRVNQVAFTVDDPEKYRGEARTKAVENARTHAEQLAKAAGVTLGKALMISESNIGVPFAEGRGVMAPAPGGMGGTPVSPGETAVTISVQVVYEVN